MRSTDCGHIPQSQIDADREADGEHSSTFKIKHLSEFLYDSGESVISLEHVRNLLADPPASVPGPTFAFADFSAGGDESVLAICRGNSVEIADAWRTKDTMSNIGRFYFELSNTRPQRIRGRGDAGGMGIVMLDRLAERGYHLKRILNNSPAQRSENFADLAAESWATVAQLIERRLIRLPPDEKLVAQMTSREKRYDSRGRLRLEPKSDMAARGVPSPDRADSVIGSIALALQNNPYAFDPEGAKVSSETVQWVLRRLERNRPVGYEPFVNWNALW